jgi:CheY-like chemotaxis protein/anti-sigma regulatory factor (Ser/Thr protein kinase)
VLLHDVSQLTAPRWRNTARAESWPVDLRVEAEPVAPIIGSRSALREALTNLVFNALDAMPCGGTITLAARQAGARALIEVADTGEGMPPEVQARIFEPFFTTKGERGTGLGLAMVFGIVQRHDGQIDVDSRPGRGTTIRLSFPIRALDRAGRREPEHGVGRALRVLVVDDETQLARLLAGMLQRDGHEVVIASSGPEALQRLRADRFGLVISDLSMGEGMNGWDLAEAIYRQDPDLPIVLATGWGASIDDEEARRRHVRVVVSKPFTIAAVRAAVAQASER